MTFWASLWIHLQLFIAAAGGLFLLQLGIRILQKFLSPAIQITQGITPRLRETQSTSGFVSQPPSFPEAAFRSFPDAGIAWNALNLQRPGSLPGDFGATAGRTRCLLFTTHPQSMGMTPK